MECEYLRSGSGWFEDDVYDRAVFLTRLVFVPALDGAEALTHSLDCGLFVDVSPAYRILHQPIRGRFPWGRSVVAWAFTRAGRERPANHREHGGDYEKQEKDPNQKAHF